MFDATTAHSSSSHRSSKTIDRANSQRRESHDGTTDLDVHVPSWGARTADVCLVLNLDGRAKLAVVILDVETVLFENEDSLLATDRSVLNANVVRVITTDGEDGLLAVWFDKDDLAVPSGVRGKWK